MRIGLVTLDKKGGMRGKIFGLGLGMIVVVFEPTVSNNNNDYFKLVADPDKEPYEIGAAFPKEKNGLLYHSVMIESPVLPAPINAALFQNKDMPGTYDLVWNRPELQGLKAEATVSVNGHAQGRRSSNGQQRLIPR